MPDPKKSTVSKHGQLNDAQKEYETDLKLMDLRNKDKNIDLDKGDNMPVKRSGFGPRTSFGGSKNPELVKSPAGYTPFKMMGHELPGIKQRTPAQMSMEKTHINDKMVDGVSKKSGVLYKGGTGGSPAKEGILGGMFGSKKNKDRSNWTGIGLANKPSAGASLADMLSSGKPPSTGGAVAPHGDEAHTGGGGGGGTMMGGAMDQAIAGGAGGASVFNVGDAIAGLEGLDRQGEKEYMAQFDQDQLARIKKHQGRQRMANQTGRSFFGVEPNKPKSSFGFGF